MLVVEKMEREQYYEIYGEELKKYTKSVSFNMHTLADKKIVTFLETYVDNSSSFIKECIRHYISNVFAKDYPKQWQEFQDNFPELEKQTLETILNKRKSIRKKNAARQSLQLESEESRESGIRRLFKR
jgi:hypothetical protein